jgi:protein-tyrosine phosphatase
MKNQIDSSSTGVLFVCLGNICRSPTSEGIFRQLAKQEVPDLDVRVDSAGTASYHIGQPPDHRAIMAAARRGIEIANLRARRVSRQDFDSFDFIIGMDIHNYQDLLSMAPLSYPGKVCLFMDFAANWQEREVPDPYYGGDNGFERVLDMIEDAATGLLDEIRRLQRKT